VATKDDIVAAGVGVQPLGCFELPALSELANMFGLALDLIGLTDHTGESKNSSRHWPTHAAHESTLGAEPAPVA